MGVAVIFQFGFVGLISEAFLVWLFYGFIGIFDFGLGLIVLLGFLICFGDLIVGFVF